MIAGGPLALHKMPWRLLAWELARSELQLILVTKEVIMMEDGKGTFAVINFKSSDEPYEGLGYQIFPDGKQCHTYKASMEDVRRLCDRISSHKCYSGPRFGNVYDSLSTSRRPCIT